MASVHRERLLTKMGKDSAARLTLVPRPKDFFFKTARRKKSGPSESFIPLKQLEVATMSKGEKQKAYMVIGCPGSGKSWVCDQLKKLGGFEYVHHDLFVGMAGDKYVKEILKASKTAKQPLLIEAPFSISQIKDPLEEAGLEIIPVFIQEEHQTIRDRYQKREKKDIPTGHLTRQETYARRAEQWNAFAGTSSEVLEHLKAIAAGGKASA